MQGLASFSRDVGILHQHDDQFCLVRIVCICSSFFFFLRTLNVERILCACFVYMIVPRVPEGVTARQLLSLLYITSCGASVCFENDHSFSIMLFLPCCYLIAIELVIDATKFRINCTITLKKRLKITFLSNQFFSHMHLQFGSSWQGLC